MISLLRAHPSVRLLTAVALCLPGVSVFAQTPAPAEPNASADRASGYYNFSMGHLYAELAQAYNRQDYIAKAIEFYRLALKQDPKASFITEELTELYIQSGQLNRAVTEAEDLLKQDPTNLGARRILGRVYTRLIGDPQQGKLDEKMLKLSIEQYSKIAEQDPEDTESQLLLARLYRLAKDQASAEKVYTAILTKNPDNDEATAGLAGILTERGDTKNAIEMLKKSIDRNASARTLVMLASLYEQANDFSSAADVWQRALAAAPDNDRWKRALAQDLLFSDRVEDARKLYEEIAADNPQDAQIQLRLSEIYRQQRDFAKARKSLEAAKQEDANNLDVRYAEVNLLDAEGKQDEAIKTLKAILDETAKKEYTSQERSQRNRLLERLGMLYRGSGKYQQAVATFREIGADESSDVAPRAAVQIIETWRQAKDMPAARRESEAAVKKFPKERIVILEQATLLTESGKVEDGVKEVLALRDGKNDRELLLAAAQLYERAKRYGEEQKLLDEAQKLSANKADVVAIRFMRGAMFEKMKDFERAEAEFRVILKDDPQNAGALNYLGYMLADRNLRLDEAQQLISKALDLDPQNGAYLDSLGWVYYRQNRLEKAEDNLRRALDKIGNDPTVHDHLGDVLLKMGKVKEAIAQWQASLKNWDAASNADTDPAEVAKVQHKLEEARVRIAQKSGGKDTR
jgi:tetratricopeptide (TPR) repeat protein